MGRQCGNADPAAEGGLGGAQCPELHLLVRRLGPHGLGPRTVDDGELGDVGRDPGVSATSHRE